MKLLLENEEVTAGRALGPLCGRRQTLCLLNPQQCNSDELAENNLYFCHLSPHLLLSYIKELLLSPLRAYPRPFGAGFVAFY